MFWGGLFILTSYLFSIKHHHPSIHVPLAILRLGRSLWRKIVEDASRAEWRERVVQAKTPCTDDDEHASQLSFFWGFLMSVKPDYGLHGINLCKAECSAHWYLRSCLRCDSVTCCWGKGCCITICLKSHKCDHQPLSIVSCDMAPLL
jgi:hypothetical protein